MDIQFTRALMEDFDEIYEKTKDSFADISEHYMGYRDFLPPGFNDGSFFKTLIPRFKIVNIVVDGNICGGYYVDRFKDNPEDMELVMLWIDTKYQNRGIGTLTWEHIENTYDTDVWWLVTPKFATSNHTFYEKLGFERIKEIDAGKVTLIQYRKKLRKKVKIKNF